MQFWQFGVVLPEIGLFLGKNTLFEFKYINLFNIDLEVENLLSELLSFHSVFDGVFETAFS